MVEIKSFLHKLNPLTGFGSTGYAIGIIAFEVILEIVTGGAGSLAKFGSRLAAKGKDAIRRICDPDGWDLLFLDGVKGRGKHKATTGRFVCTGAHCFLAGTLIAAAGGDWQPIERYQLLDRVHSFTEYEYEGYGADAEVYDPFVSAEQKRLDRITAADAEQWASADFSAMSGSGEVSLVRPASWFAEHRETAPGACVALSLPEVGVDGLYRLDRLTRLTARQTADLLHDSLGSGTITGIFRHRAERVKTLLLRGSTTVDTIRVTPPHLFYDALRRSWTPADQLRVNDVLLGNDGEWVIVSAIQEEDIREAEVYNFEIRGTHRYTVGRNLSLLMLLII